MAYIDADLLVGKTIGFFFLLYTTMDMQIRLKKNKKDNEEMWCVSIHITLTYTS